MPEYAHDVDAGMDIRCREDTWILANSSALFDTGVHVQIPKGYFGKLESKSGLNCRKNIESAGGVIDCGYTGSIVVKLWNHSNVNHLFKAGDKIVQMIILPCEHPELVQVDDLEETERGNGGFGSTGR